MKQNICKSFGKQYGLHLYCPLRLLVHVSANVMIISLLLRISDICRLLTPYSADKLVPFSSFSNRKIIACLSFIERTACVRFKDKMIVNKYLWRSVACLPKEPIEREISLSNKATLWANENSFESSALVTTCVSASLLCFLIHVEKQTRIYFTFQCCSFKKNMARGLNDD